MWTVLMLGLLVVVDRERRNGGEQIEYGRLGASVSSVTGKDGTSESTGV